MNFTNLTLLTAAVVICVLLMRGVMAWWYTGQFVPPQDPPASYAAVAASPYNPDQVVQEVGRREYLKGRLEIGPRSESPLRLPVVHRRSLIE